MSQTFVYDPTTTRFQEEMHDVYRVLRDDWPVYVSPEGTYVLSRFADVWGAVHDWRAFSSTCAEAEQLMPQMIYMDPPRHTALRALVSAPSRPGGWPGSRSGSGRWRGICSRRSWRRVPATSCGRLRHPSRAS